MHVHQAALALLFCTTLFNRPPSTTAVSLTSLMSAANTGLAVARKSTRVLQHLARGEFYDALHVTSGDEEHNKDNVNRVEEWLTDGREPLDKLVAAYWLMQGDPSPLQYYMGFSQHNSRLGRIITANSSQQDKQRHYPGSGTVIYTDEWFDDKYRNKNVLPLSVQQMNVTFHLSVSSEHGEVISEGYVNESDATILKSGFNASLMTYIFTHGYMSSAKRPNVIGNRLLASRPCNVILVDWQQGAKGYYTQVVANIITVAMATSKLVLRLQNVHDLDVSRLHIIGHSLGAHAAGYVGRLVKGLGRITGLDPAGPAFDHMPPAIRLDHSDAQFVDVIHTDIGNGRHGNNNGFGAATPSGHVDYYVNGGDQQPGCSQPEEYLTSVLKGSMACRHSRAKDLFASSIIIGNTSAARNMTDQYGQGCRFIAHECPSYADYINGKCWRCSHSADDHCNWMGLPASKQHLHGRHGVRLYLSTNSQPPFCLQPYRLQFGVGSVTAGSPKQASSSDSNTTHVGRLQLAVHGSSANVTDFALPVNGLHKTAQPEQEGTFKRIVKNIVRMFGSTGDNDDQQNQLELVEGDTHQSLVLAHSHLGQPQHLALTWHASDSQAAETPLVVRQVQLQPLTVSDHAQTSHMLPSTADNSTLHNKSPIVLFHNTQVRLKPHTNTSVAKQEHNSTDIAS